MHAFDEATQATLCGRPEPGLHHWPAMDFPRLYGSHCDVCSAAMTDVAQALGEAR